MELLTVTLNPALDLTYRVPELVAGGSVRVAEVTGRAGGKGVNVATVAQALGATAQALVLVGGPGSDELTDGLTDLGLRTRAVMALAGIRRTIAVVPDQGDTTILLEPGSRVTAPEEVSDQVLKEVAAALAEGVGAVVVSGSLAPGVPAELPARIAERCREAGIPCVVDTSGEALGAAVGSGAVLKPNREELEQLRGPLGAEPAALADAAGDLLTGGAPACLVTLGAAGLLLRTPQGAWLARPPEQIAGNATGAGDAAAAALALGLAKGSAGGVPDWPVLLADVVATSAAAVLSPVAGELDLAARERWLPLVRIDELPGAEGMTQ